jgi:hypothetical protein
MEPYNRDKKTSYFTKSIEDFIEINEYTGSEDFNDIIQSFAAIVSNTRVGIAEAREN